MYLTVSLESTVAAHTVVSLLNWRILAVLMAAVAPIPAEAGDVESRIQRVEQGLRPGITVPGQHPVRWSIAERLRVYKVPGVSVAVISNRKVEWARG